MFEQIKTKNELIEIVNFNMIKKKENVCYFQIATPEYNFFIITGPNMSGKTVYIKTIAVLQIMAQVSYEQNSIAFFIIFFSGKLFIPFAYFTLAWLLCSREKRPIPDHRSNF